MPSGQKVPPRSIDEYLAGLPPKGRGALERVRRLIGDAAPESVESILYGLPTIRQGRMRLNFAAFKDHCSLYGWARVREEFAEELKPFEAGRGTLRFTPDHPLPARLVSRVVKALLRLNDEP